MCHLPSGKLWCVHVLKARPKRFSESLLGPFTKSVAFFWRGCSKGCSQDPDIATWPLQKESKRNSLLHPWLQLFSKQFFNRLLIHAQIGNRCCSFNREPGQTSGSVFFLLNRCSAWFLSTDNQKPSTRLGPNFGPQLRSRRMHSAPLAIEARLFADPSEGLKLLPHVLATSPLKAPCCVSRGNLLKGWLSCSFQKGNPSKHILKWQC